MEKMTKNSYLFKMSVPIFIELLLQLLVGNIDQIMVSRYSQGVGGGDCQWQPDYEYYYHYDKHALYGDHRRADPVSGGRGQV